MRCHWYHNSIVCCSSLVVPPFPMQRILCMDAVRPDLPIERQLRSSYMIIHRNLNNLVAHHHDIQDCIGGLLYALLLDFKSSLMTTFLHLSLIHI